MLRPPNPGNLSKTGLPHNQNSRRHGGLDMGATDANALEELRDSNRPGPRSQPITHPLSNNSQARAIGLHFTTSLCLGNNSRPAP